MTSFHSRNIEMVSEVTPGQILSNRRRPTRFPILFMIYRPWLWETGNADQGYVTKVLQKGVRVKGEGVAEILPSAVLQRCAELDIHNAPPLPRSRNSGSFPTSPMPFCSHREQAPIKKKANYYLYEVRHEKQKQFVADDFTSLCVFPGRGELCYRRRICKKRK